MKGMNYETHLLNKRPVFSTTAGTYPQMKFFDEAIRG